MRLSIGAAAASVFLCGCATVGQYLPVPLYIQGITNVDIAAPFDEAQARRMLAPGSLTLSGTAAMKIADGSRRLCDGTSVALIPATDFAAERMQSLFADQHGGVRTSPTVLRFRPVEEAYNTLQRSTNCDAQGRFRFEGLSPGEFFVVAIVNVFSGNTFAGGYVMQRVTVSGDTSVEIAH